MSFDRLKDILEIARRKHPQFSKRMDEAQALSRWDQAVGEQIAKHSRAVSVKNGMLCVEVDHPIWRSELHHRKAQILEVLNKGLADGQPVFTDIWFMDPRNPTPAPTDFSRLGRGRSPKKP